MKKNWHFSAPWSMLNCPLSFYTRKTNQFIQTTKKKIVASLERIIYDNPFWSTQKKEAEKKNLWKKTFIVCRAPQRIFNIPKQFIFQMHA